MSSNAAILTIAQRADETVRQVLRSQYTGDPALLVDSPPGAGKTRLVEDLARSCNSAV